MENEYAKEYRKAVSAYAERFGRIPMTSPDGWPSAEEIMHAALTGIDLEEPEYEGKLTAKDWERIARNGQ